VLDAASNTVFFVAGCGEGPGTTLLACALIRRLVALSHSAVGLLPIDTGCSYSEKHDLISSSGTLLWIASNKILPPAVVAPYRFAPAIPPAAALQRAGLLLKLEDHVSAKNSAAEFGDPVVVLCNGGANVPLTEDGNALDLAERLGATILITAPDKRSAASEILLAIEGCRRRAINIGGVILTTQDGVESTDYNEDIVKERGGVVTFATLVYPAADDDETVRAAVQHLEQYEVAEKLLEAVKRP